MENEIKTFLDALKPALWLDQSFIQLGNGILIAGKDSSDTVTYWHKFHYITDINASAVITKADRKVFERFLSNMSKSKGYLEFTEEEGYLRVLIRGEKEADYLLLKDQFPGIKFPENELFGVSLDQNLMLSMLDILYHTHDVINIKADVERDNVILSASNEYVTANIPLNRMRYGINLKGTFEVSFPAKRLYMFVKNFVKSKNPVLFKANSEMVWAEVYYPADNERYNSYGLMVKPVIKEDQNKEDQNKAESEADAQ